MLTFWKYFRITILLGALAALPLWLDPHLGADDPLALVAANVLPLAVVAMVLVGFTRRPLLSLLLLGGFVAWMFFVNAKKLETLKEPAVFSDFLLVGQTIRGFDLLGHYGSPVLLILCVLAYLAFAGILALKEPPVLRYKRSVPLALVGVLLLLSLGQERWPLGSLYQKAPLTPQEWDPVNSAKLNGLIGSMTRAAARTRFELPEPGTAPSAPTEPVEGLVTDPLVQPPRRPDIVILLAESFFEPGILVDIEPCQSLPDWCALADRGLSGTLVVPTYGGNTTRTEFELLTGVPFATFGGLDYVYLSVVTRPLYSIPWMLRDQGYETVAIHNHMGFFWNRNEALPRLGFEKYVSVEQMEGVKELGFYARDDVLTGELLDVLDSGGRSAPMMAFVITMENHGPWNANRRGRLPAEVSDIDVPEVVAGLEGEPLQQYLFHAGRFVDQVTAIWDVLAQRERDTLLVVFGDHLPGMATVFDRLGFDDGLLAPQQPTPYVVLANYDLPGTPPTHLPVHQLLPQALHAAGLELGELYGELQAVYRVVPNGDPAIAERRDQRISHLQWRVLGEPVTAGQSSAD